MKDRFPATAAYVSRALVLRLRAADSRIRLLSNLAAARDAIVGGHIAVLIADPAADDGRAGDFMVSVREAFPSVVVVAYCCLTPDLASRLLRLGKAGVTEVILQDYDDSPARFRALVDLGCASAMVSRVLSMVEPKLGVAGEHVTKGVRQLFDTPTRFRAVDDLAVISRMPRRSLYRTLEKAGFPSPRRFLTAARVVRAIGLLRDPGRTVRDVAIALRYSKPDDLARHMLAFTGYRTRELRELVDDEMLAVRIAERLQSPH